MSPKMGYYEKLLVKLEKRKVKLDKLEDKKTKRLEKMQGFKIDSES